MAFPTVAGRAISTTPLASESTSHSVTLPASIVAGDLLIVSITINGGTGVATLTATGWTQIGTVVNESTSVGQWWFYRKATGVEGPAVTFTSDTTQSAVHRSWRIAVGTYDADTVPEIATVAIPSGDVDPPNLAPSWGAEDTLWLVGAGIVGVRTISAAPSNYTNLATGNTGGADTGGDATGGWAERELNASAENPGVYTTDAVAARDKVAATVAIRTAAANFPFHGPFVGPLIGAFG